ncbi:MAG: hypothetical protein MUF71_04210 [Candidatus Kapabacteria bacterium]|jgi:ketopantoate reductase|nr:hypothetical protein [Candidatus Kapabacteria bacterium]
MNEQQWQYLLQSFWQQLSKFADAISVIGAAASMYAAWQIRTIVKRFRFRAEVPKLVVSVEDSTDRLSQLLGKFDRSKNEILAILAQCDAHTKTLAQQLVSLKEFDQADQRDIERIREMIKEATASSNLEESNVREIWTKLIFINERVKNLINLLQWER